MAYSDYLKGDLKKVISALAIAITGNHQIDIIMVSGKTRAVADKLYLAELKQYTLEAMTNWRGYIDRALFKIAYHDVMIERKYRPEGAKSSLLYSFLMQLRYEICGIDNFAGSYKNIASIYQKQNLNKEYIEEEGVLLISNILCPNLTPYLDYRQDCYKKYHEFFTKFKQDYADIQAYAKIAAQFAELFCDQSQTSAQDHAFSNDFLVDGFHNHTDITPRDETLQADEDTPPCENIDADTSENISEADEITPTENSFGDAESKAVSQEFFEDMGFVQEADIENLRSRKEYKIYTHKYDEVIEAEKLVTATESQKLYQELSLAKKNHLKITQKLSRKLRSRLLSHQEDSYNYDLYQGVLDHQKISNILTDPFDGRYFKDEMPIIAENTAVTLLIDNSGSMRGKPITMAALCADIIAETIERCGAKVEVLGFTTKAWRGGQSRKDYEKDGCPPMPGRLNDLHHIIYKDFNMPIKAATRSIAVMLKESLLKENIDGEALMWAGKRLLARPEKRKILTVISDGAPVDDSTSSANNSDYLDAHLRNVLYYFENKTDIDIFALGIGHDVQNYYKKSVTVPNADDVASALTEKFVRLF